MPSKSPTVMTITVPVTRRMMMQAAEVSLYDLDDYDDEVLKKAGVSRKRLSAELIADPNFQAQVSKQMLRAAQEGIVGAFDYSNIGNSNHPLVTVAIKAADRAHKEREKTRTERERNERIKDATALLREAGYRVVRD
jgi:hypothetical protein